MSDLKSYIITLKEKASDADKLQLKQKISDLGGSIVSEVKLINGYVAKLPSVHFSSIKGHEHVNSIEEDSEVKIQ
ncbi:Piso0_003110 [Millerozyma farinosa CBS 7064]|uniref:Piso0_003110 protein n=1 Tax=Pichia sorbitophila (strain ATCC MYA-4447 / BCRC 22081 / CBS 7064 / NBRC 10061 / NRRL Y-12695) TaxID=559304 RepID=G8YKD4_PICSO|nr:Piso0_003110 [Millerozyma farinosa CBS 7064]CCE80779.1 Piso0_003110 [Millerozyma farinosa CBS 7064]